MAEEAEDILEDDGADGPEDGGSKRKKLILFIVLPLLLLIGVGVGVAVMLDYLVRSHLQMSMKNRRKLKKS